MSGAALIGVVPQHWSVKPLRLLGRLLKGTGGSKVDVVEDGVPCVRYGDLYTTHNNFIDHARTYLDADRADDYTPIEYGDVLFAASGETIEEIGKSAVNLLHGARCGGDLVILRPTAPTVARFLGYAMDAAPVAAQKALAGRGTTVKHIYPDELREVVIAVPPLGEQQAIADFLDRETARLDALVAAKQRVLDLLDEKRKVIIATAVTRGLDPQAKLRDTGEQWLGEVPAHWKTCQLRRVLTSMDYGTSQTVEPEGLVAVLRMGDMSGGELDFTRIGYVDAIDEYLLLRPGDLLFNRTNSLDQIGKVAKFRGWSGIVSFASYLVRLRLSRDSDSEFLNYLLNSSYVLARAQAEALPAIGQVNLNPNRYSYIVVAMPPIAEQLTIVEYIARETAKIDAMRAATERTISLLKERRTALIAAVVTGKFDVGGAK